MQSKLTSVINLLLKIQEETSHGAFFKYAGHVRKWTFEITSNKRNPLKLIYHVDFYEYVDDDIKIKVIKDQLNEILKKWRQSNERSKSQRHEGNAVQSA